MELEIKGTTYGFKFGFGFMRELDEKVQVPVSDVPGKKEKVGFSYTLTKMLNDDVESLVDILLTANKTTEPRIKRADLEDYIDSDECDIEELFKTVTDFLLKSNVTKKVTGKQMKAVEQANQEAEA